MTLLITVVVICLTCSILALLWGIFNTDNELSSCSSIAATLLFFLFILLCIGSENNTKQVDLQSINERLIRIENNLLYEHQNND